MIYIKLLMVALITIYVVDLSGFTESWKAGLKRLLGISSIKSIKPFDCSLCMVWWLCLIYAACAGALDIYTMAYSALLSFLSIPLGQVIIFIREWMLHLINKCFPR